MRTKFYQKLIAAFLVVASILPHPVAAADTAGLETVNARGETFAQWLSDFRKKMEREGLVSDPTLAELDTAVMIPDIIAKDRNQKEKKAGIPNFAAYRKQNVTGRVSKGREILKQYADELDAVEKEYGVPREYVVAIWGIESNYGHHTGSYDVISASATLAWDGRREKLFTDQLKAGLLVLDKKFISRGKFKGSYLAAMGQPQFLPTSYLDYGADGDGDGRIDIWDNVSDVFASTANYMKKHGWIAEERWGRGVKVPDSLSHSLIHTDMTGRPKHGKTLAEWHKLGVTLPDGGPLPATSGMTGYLVAPSGSVKGEVFLVYNNFLRIMDYNNSTQYAAAVGLLADRLKASP